MLQCSACAHGDHKAGLEPLQDGSTLCQIGRHLPVYLPTSSCTGIGLTAGVHAGGMAGVQVGREHLLGGPGAGGADVAFGRPQHNQQHLQQRGTRRSLKLHEQHLHREAGGRNLRVRNYMSSTCTKRQGGGTSGATIVQCAVLVVQTWEHALEARGGHITMAQDDEAWTVL